jgi:hypothetical protein
MGHHDIVRAKKVSHHGFHLPVRVSVRGRIKGKVRVRVIG